MVFLEKYTDLDWSGLLKDQLVVVPVQSDPNKHRCENRISLVYLHNLTTNQEYVIGCHHTDLYQNGEEWIGQVEWPDYTFCYRKSVLSRFGRRMWDVDLCYWLEFNEAIDTEPLPEIAAYHRWYRMEPNINDVIPAVSWVAYGQNIVDNFKQCVYSIHIDKTLKFYNDIVLNNFCSIENAGIPANRELARKYFSSEANTLYSEYFMYTATGRPSNRFGGINFAALDKSTGVREVIQVTSPDQLLMEFDYDSYHVRLVAKLIGYQLPEGNLHEYFGRQYFNTPALTAEQYQQSKLITFRMLYGNIFPEYAEIKFFKMVHQFRRDLWKQFQDAGYIETPMTGRKIYDKNFTDMTANKLFNYVLQGYETDVNSIMLHDILEYLYKKSSKLILYTYDSFLFLYERSDGKEFIADIENILNRFGLHSSLKIGKNYNEMVAPKGYRA